MKIDRTKNYQIYTNYFHPSTSKLFSHKKTFFVREKTFFRNLQTQLGAPNEPRSFSLRRFPRSFCSSDFAWVPLKVPFHFVTRISRCSPIFVSISHFCRGPPSQLMRNQTGADDVGAAELAAMGCVVDECDVRAASDKAPRMPAADTSLDSTFHGEVQAGLRFLETFMTIHASDPFPRHAMPISASRMRKPVGPAGCVRGVPDYGFRATASPADENRRRVEERSVGGLAS